MSNKSLDGVLTKKAHQRERFTEEQIADLVACSDEKTGFEAFAKKFFFIQHPVKGKCIFEPFAYQTRLLHSYHDFRFNINMLPRQSGKTTTAACYLLWYAMFHPDQTILIAAHKYTGAQEIMQRIRYGYELCPDFVRAGVTNYNKGSMEFENGSRIVSATTTGNTGRGMSISLLYCDEFAFVNPGIAQEFWTSISPTLATGGRAIITSTPNSDEDVFATIWRESQNKFDEHGNEQELGINGFHGYTASWDEHPERDEEWKKQELGRIGEERFRREYGCEFLVYDETLVNSLILTTLEGTDPILNMGQTRWYKKLDPHATYVVALDPAMGTGGDNAAIEVFELPTYKQVAEWKHNTTPIPQQIRIMRDICNYIKEETKSSGSNIYWSVENNTIGESALLVINDFGEDSIPGLFVSEPIRKGHIRKFRKGFNTTHKTKISACSRLKNMVEKEKLKIYSKPLISELKSFIAAGSSFKAKSGQTDDLVSATLLIMRIISVLKDWDPKIYTSFSQADEDTADKVMPMPIFVSH
jgi:hypothetical protein|tara:strand:+ start:878 stop:2461 length:1584 start_codon:yes stop_codon:yes gene_type:complete